MGLAGHWALELGIWFSLGVEVGNETFVRSLML